MMEYAKGLLLPMLFSSLNDDSLGCISLHLHSYLRLFIDQ